VPPPLRGPARPPAGLLDSSACCCEQAMVLQRRNVTLT
jgi:hypothetical protein